MINLDFKIQDTEGNDYQDSAASWVKRMVADRLSDKESDFLTTYDIVSKINKDPKKVELSTGEAKVLKESIEKFKQINPHTGQPLVNDYMKAQLFRAIDQAK